MHPDEVEATRALLDWARPGDLLLLSTLSQRQAVLELVNELETGGWQPGGS
jgi:hypothetical protein